jgi:4-hydroxybenzoate polyprenyltransferase
MISTERDAAVMQFNLQRSVDAVPLCVDLDGTLVRSDLLVESIFALLKRNVLYLFLLPLWLLKGKAFFKQQIAERTELDVTVLPYQAALLDYLRGQRANRRRLILATASNIKIAQQIASHLDLFDQVLASGPTVNLSGQRKLERLRAAFGEKGFDYVGNARVDLKIWPYARQAILVSPKRRLHTACSRLAPVERVFDEKTGGIRAYLEAMRLHQWLKNVLVFVPLAAAHQIGDPQLLLQAVLALLAFGLCASGVYLLNDLLDLPADRHHPRKRNRPFAAGTVPILHGTLLIPVLLLLAVGIAWLLPAEFLSVLVIYYLATLSYSLWLKQVVLLDVLVLAGLYTIRIIAGGAAVSIFPSFWLLAFSMFLFLSLAMIKRYSELRDLQDKGHQKTRGRDYQVTDLSTLISLGSSSGYLAVLVLALYINSADVRELYTRPEGIWLLCPVMLYWVSRMWLVTQRGGMHDDPVIFALKDPISQWLGVLGAITLLLAA